MSFDVFLCHNSKDKAAVREIEQRLTKAGLKPWFDESQLRPGQVWQRELERQIATIRTAAVFVGPDGFGPWQNLELEAFLRQFVKRGCPVIPVILASCASPPDLPVFLEGMMWVDFRQAVPNPLKQLIWGIRGDRAVAPEEPAKAGLPLNNLPFASLGGLFEGREDMLAELGKHLFPGSPTALVQAQTVSGLGGVGKTRLAIEFAYRNAVRFSAIFFVGADGEAALRSNFAGLARRGLLDLGLPPSMPEDAVLEEVKLALRERRPGWLLIFDNVDDAEAQQAVRRLLPLPGGQVLITSRLQNWPAGTQQMQVDKLEPQAALDYLLKATDNRRRRVNDEEMAARLAANLGYLPLGLELTAAYVRVNSLAFGELLADWAKEEQNLLEWFDPGATDYSRSLAVTWALSFEKLTKPAQVVLSLLAHLAPEPIPRAMFEEGGAILAEAAGGDLDLRAALADLLRYSLIALEQDSEQKTITLHRLVQSVARGQIPSEKRVLWAERVIGLVTNFAPKEVNDVRTWPIWDPLRPHASRVIEIAEEVGIADHAAILMDHLGVLLKTKALFAEAENLQRRALALGEASLGDNHPVVGTRLNNLAALLHDTNRRAEAEPLMRRALAIDEASLGKDHPEVAIDLNNLALLLLNTNRPAEAEPLMRRALAIDEAIDGKDHPHAARHLSNLASLLQATDRLAEAEPLIRRALAIDEASFGKDHPVVAIRLNNLGQLLWVTSWLAEAEPLMRRALSISEATFGKDHPNVAICLSNLAQLLQATNRLTEAEPLMRWALSIEEASLGQDHPDVAIDLNNLASLLQATDRLAEAEPLMRRALAILEHSLGNDHPTTAIIRNNLEILLAAISAGAADLPSMPEPSDI